MKISAGIRAERHYGEYSLKINEMKKCMKGALPLCIGTCPGEEPGLGMLGIACMKHKISMVVFVAFFFAPLPLLVWDYVAGRGGGGGC